MYMYQFPPLSHYFLTTLQEGASLSIHYRETEDTQKPKA